MNENVIVPSTIDGKSVTTITINPQSYMKTLYLNEGITLFKPWFSDTLIKNISVPASIETIEPGIWNAPVSVAMFFEGNAPSCLGTPGGDNGIVIYRHTGSTGFDVAPWNAYPQIVY